MSDTLLDFENEDVAQLEALLADRIYEFNAYAIDRFDAKTLGAAIRDESGEIVAAISGYTWAGSCQITYLWVTAEQRRNGLGRTLLAGAEAEAVRRGCEVIRPVHAQFPGTWLLRACWIYAAGRGDR